jgi:hypothetical protein
MTPTRSWDRTRSAESWLSKWRQLFLEVDGYRQQAKYNRGRATVLSMRDGLPKLKDFPAEFGGSGEQMPG